MSQISHFRIKNFLIFLLASLRFFFSLAYYSPEQLFLNGTELASSGQLYEASQLLDQACKMGHVKACVSSSYVRILSGDYTGAISFISRHSRPHGDRVVFNQRSDPVNIISWLLDVERELGQVGEHLKSVSFMQECSKQGLIRHPDCVASVIWDTRVPFSGVMAHDDHSVFWFKSSLESSAALLLQEAEMAMEWAKPIDKHQGVVVDGSRVVGDYALFLLIDRGVFVSHRRAHATFRLLAPIAILNTPLGQSHFSYLNGAIVSDRGPTNYRLSAIMLLSGSLSLDVASSHIVMEKGKMVVFEDHCRHSLRGEMAVYVVLQMYHPYLASASRMSEVEKQLRPFIPKEEEEQIEERIAKWKAEQKQRAMAQAMMGAMGKRE